MSSLINHLYRFGDFTLDADQRVLMRAGKPVALTPKVFDTLLILVENPGRIVEKDELMRRLWPDTFVEEANITFNIQQLRKSLSDDARNPRYVGTVARRGYRFIADVEAVSKEKVQTGGQNGSRFETVVVLSPDIGTALISPVQKEPEPVIIPETEQQFSNPGENVIPAAAVASTGVSKKFIALVGATLVLLAGMGLVIWKFSSGSIRSLAEGKRVDGKSAVALPFKVERLTVTGQSRHAAISPDGKYVAYTRQVEKESSIWLRQFATNTNVEIVPTGGIVFGLAFANSGDYVYFVKGNPTALYRVSLFGGVPTKIVDNLEGNFSISADDSQIALIRQAITRNGEQQYSLIIANSDGKSERTLLTGTYPNRLNVPLWSPDGKSIICTSGASEGGGRDVSIVEVSVADGTKKELSSDRFFHITKMAWLPDKHALVISARKNLDDNNQLWRVSYPAMEVSRMHDDVPNYLDLSVASGADKAVATQAIRISDIWVAPIGEPKHLKKITQAIDIFSWAPNGRLVYTSTASGHCDLWITQPDGTEQRQLTVNAGVNSAPAVTPDKRYIVFSSNRTGSSQIWRMNLDGANQVQLTNGTAKGHPTVSPDGKWVIFNTTDDWYLWKISIEGGQPLQLTNYIASRPSVSPDGKLIAGIGRNESRREIVILPFEGGAPLKKIEFPGSSLSGTRIVWTPDGKAVFYTASLGGPTAIFKQSLDGSPPKETASFEQDQLFDFGYSADGQFLAIIRGEWQHDILLISDLNR